MVAHIILTFAVLTKACVVGYSKVAASKYYDDRIRQARIREYNRLAASRRPNWTGQDAAAYWRQFREGEQH